MNACRFLLFIVTFTFKISSSTAEYINHFHDSINLLKSLSSNRDIRQRPQRLTEHVPHNFLELETLIYNSSPENVARKLQEVFLQNATDQNFTDVSPGCINDTEIIIGGLLERQSWAYTLFDSIGKLPAGVLQGNTKWLGSYDQCVGLQVKNDSFETQYCSANIPVKGGLVAKLLGNESYTGFVSMYGAPKLVIGLCVPKRCNAKDTAGLVNTLLLLFRMNLTQMHLNENDILCQREDRQLDTTAVVAIVVSSTILFLVIFGTLFDILIYQPAFNSSIMPSPHVNGLAQSTSVSKLRVGEYTPLLQSGKGGSSGGGWKTNGILDQILVSFSVYTNGSKLLSTKQNAGALTCVNGIRFISMTWVILGHTFAFAIAGYADNIVSYSRDVYTRWTFMAVANAFYSVDSFFVLSGLLVSYLTLREMEKKGVWINWSMFFFHRFWRLTPPYMLVLLIYVGTFGYWASGPMWIENTEPFCKDHWWQNLLYINNLFDPYKECFAWGWYLANDMQFFVLSPIFLITLHWSWVAGGLALTVTLLAHLITTGAISSHLKAWPGLAGGGDPNIQPLAEMYFHPWTRIGPYLVGLGLGYILCKTQCRKMLNWWLALIGWAVAGVFCLSILYGVYDTYQGNPPSTEVSALYNSLSRTLWAFGLAWVIYACCTGYGGFVNTILSWEAFVPLGRLTYMAYLVHPIVIYLSYNSRHQLIHMTDLTSIYLFIGHVTLAYGAAFVCSLVLEAPMLGLEKAILKRNK